jgi:hypothetical protein
MNTVPKPTSGPGIPRYSAVKLLVALGCLFVVTPFIEELPRGDLIEAVLVTLVMIFSVHAVSREPRTLILAIILGAPAVAGKWINRMWPDLLPPAWFLVPAFIFFIFVVAHLVSFIVRSPRVDTDVICAGVAGFIMLGLVWAPLYLLAAQLNPEAFVLSSGGKLDGFSAFYLSFITLCTVGYGDVTPVSKVARMLAVIEAITGIFYMAVLISRLVSIYSSAPASDKPADR